MTRNVEVWCVTLNSKKYSDHWTWSQLARDRQTLTCTLQWAGRGQWQLPPNFTLRIRIVVIISSGL